MDLTPRGLVTQVLLIKSKDPLLNLLYLGTCSVTYDNIHSGVSFNISITAPPPGPTWYFGACMHPENTQALLSAIAIGGGIVFNRGGYGRLHVGAEFKLVLKM